MITYKTTRDFTKKQVEDLFLSVKWISGQYPDKLFQSLQQSSYVLTAWDDEQLVGLIRGLDDGCMTAFLHYLLISPDYQHQGIASQLVEQAKEHYKDFFYINIMPEESKNASFYECHGFSIMPDGVAMQKHNKDFK
ncbi:MAG: GNAT family N-acetyltransferase [Bacteroidales bacterium]|nr:GNAT family N-acetyltransferase [Bacteroidales bacterium]